MYDYEQFKDTLLSRGVQAACIACGDTNVRATTTNPVALIETNPDGLIELDRMSRMVIATYCGTQICTNCGYVALHALVPIGLGQGVLPNPELN